MLGNHVLRLRSRVAIKLNFRPYIRRYTSPNENFEYSYPLNDTPTMEEVSMYNGCKLDGESLLSGCNSSIFISLIYAWICSWHRVIEDLQPIRG